MHLAGIRAAVVLVPRVPSRLPALLSLISATPRRALLDPPIVGIVPARVFACFYPPAPAVVVAAAADAAAAAADVAAAAAAGSAGTARIAAGVAKTAAIAN
eukprot:1871595-Pyramimonas_sp.AAC.2